VLGVIIAVGALAAAVVAVVLEGRRLPVEHQASRCLRLRQSPHSVWGTLTDIDGFTAWRPSLARVERLPEVAGRMRWREHEGRGKITFEAVEAAPPQRFTTRIADPSLPFGGTWTYVITPTPEGCTVTITERGEVYNPIFRFVSRYIMGHTATIDRYLKALAARFGEDAAVESA